MSEKETASERKARNQQTKMDDFVRLAKSRGDKCLDQFRLLENLASYAYKIEPTAAKKLIKDIETALANLKKIWKMNEDATMTAAMPSEAEITETK